MRKVFWNALTGGFCLGLLAALLLSTSCAHLQTARACIDAGVHIAAAIEEGRRLGRELPDELAEAEQWASDMRGLIDRCPSAELQAIVGQIEAQVAAIPVD